LVYFSTPRSEERTTLLSEVTDLTSIEYNSFDVCPGLKTELLDLNFESVPEKYCEYYDVVLNVGTTEHVLNQWNCFEVIHDATRVGGAIYHQLPATGYLDHGYFTYTPLFFRDLATANDYEVIDIFFTLAGLNELLRLGIDVRAEAMLLVPNSDQLAVFDRRVPCFEVHVVMRKRRSGRFRCGLEIATAHASVNQAMALRYATEDEPRARLAAATSECNGLRDQLTKSAKRCAKRTTDLRQSYPRPHGASPRRSEISSESNVRGAKANRQGDLFRRPCCPLREVGVSNAASYYLPR